MRKHKGILYDGCFAPQAIHNTFGRVLNVLEYPHYYRCEIEREIVEVDIDDDTGECFDVKRTRVEVHVFTKEIWRAIERRAKEKTSG